MATTHKKDQLIHTRIISAKQTIFEGNVAAITSTNAQGKFDILPYHANFLTLIQNKPIILTFPDKKTQTFVFPIGILYCRDNIVDIFTDIQLSEEDFEKELKAP